MADKLKFCASKLEDEAEAIDKYTDATVAFEVAGDIVSHITNCFNSLRLDLLINRPIREMSKEIYRLKQKKEE